MPLFQATVRGPFGGDIREFVNEFASLDEAWKAHRYALTMFGGRILDIKEVVSGEGGDMRGTTTDDGGTPTA